MTNLKNGFSCSENTTKQLQNAKDTVMSMGLMVKSDVPNLSIAFTVHPASSENVEEFMELFPCGFRLTNITVDRNGGFLSGTLRKITGFDFDYQTTDDPDTASEEDCETGFISSDVFFDGTATGGDLRRRFCKTVQPEQMIFNDLQYDENGAIASAAVWAKINGLTYDHFYDFEDEAAYFTNHDANHEPCASDDCK